MTRERRNLRDGILFLTPNIIGFVAFTAFPLVFSLVLAFSNFDLKLHNRFKPEGHLRFVGFSNFTALLSDREFWKYLGNTLFLMIAMPFSIAASLISAIMLSKDLRGGNRTWMWMVAAAILFAGALMLACAGAHGSAMTVLICGVISAVILIGTIGGTTAYRTLFYLPYFTSGVATLLLWKKMYAPQSGPINAMLGAIGISGPDWLGSYHWAKPALMLMGFWAAVGSNTMLLYLAALTNVPLELYEAADIDGASRWTRFWNITWPQLAPTTFFIVIMGIIGGLQAGFDAARIMTGGGPAGATTTLAYMIYVEGFVTGRAGYASAAAWILFLLVLIITLIYWRFGTGMSTIDTRRKLLPLATLHVALIAIALAMIVPFVWMVLTSLKTSDEVGSENWLPHKAQWSNYADVFDTPTIDRPLAPGIPFARYYWNSIFIASWVTFLQVVTSAMAAYSFARIRWRGRDKIFLAYLATMMLPGLVMMIPNYQIMIELRLVDTFTGLILPAAFSTYGTFLLRQFMLTIPTSLDEAAEIDGAGHWRTFLDIILPLSRPGLITLTIFTFLGNYQSFFWPLVMLKDQAKLTLPIGMMYFENSRYSATHLLMAAVTMSVLPLVVLFIVMQKYLVRGIQLGAVKG